MHARSEDTPPYLPDEEVTIAAALAILAKRVNTRDVLAGPTDVQLYLRLHLGRETREVFSVLYLDAQNRVIKLVDEFFGTLNQTSVYPREIVRSALAHNAASVIFSHNHPSGSVEPSRADEQLTKVLKQALDLVDVRVLDHVIVAAGATFSMAEKGLL